MSNTAIELKDYDAVARVVHRYIDGAISGKGEDMRPAFFDAATIFGYAGEDLFGGPIELLFDWNNQNGAATELQARIASIDLVETVATVRLELNNWNGARYTDLFTLLKVDGEWKIMSKVFHVHS